MAEDEFTILGVAKAVSADLEEYGTHQLGAYVTMAKRGYRELKLSSLMKVKTVKLPLNTYHALDLPSDCMAWVATGIQYGDKVLVLGTAEDVALYHDKDDCGVPIDNPHQRSLSDTLNGTNPESYMPYWFSGWDGGNISGLVDGDPTSFCGYHTGLNYKGFFNWDKDANQLQFSTNVNVKNVLLMYISDASSCNESTKVEAVVFKWLVCYVHEKRTRHRRDYSEAAKDAYGKDLHYAHLELKHMVNPLFKEDIINVARQGYRLSPRTH